MLVIGNGVSSKLSFVELQFVSKAELNNEVDELQKQIDTYKSGMITLDILKRENKELSETLSRSQHTNKVLVPATILAKPPQTPYDVIILDVGKSNGVDVGDYVYVSDNIFLGRVIRANEKTSSVHLASSPGIETQSVVFPVDMFITVTGLGGGIFQAKLPIDIHIEVGDRVVTRGSSPYVVGIVEEVISRPSDSFQTIKAISPINIGNLSWVSVYSVPEVVEVDEEAS